MVERWLVGSRWALRVLRSTAVEPGRPLLIGGSTLVVLCAPVRYADRRVERVRALAVAEAVEVVRAGLAHLVPRDALTELLADQGRPEVLPVWERRVDPGPCVSPAGCDRDGACVRGGAARCLLLHPLRRS